MRAFKNKAFSKWAAREGLSDAALLAAVEEMTRGLVDANLGGRVFKKRVAVGRRGKSGGVRTLLAYRTGDKAFFVYGFAKNARGNISDRELKALKLYANTLLSYSKAELNRAVKSGALIEVVNDG
ncbi:MAG: type II toxin-antitoxin system RelE/ParE family toxin [Halioglobus sp.]|nr:type II toxin-antitoxin system RelE/ParE family toxin [Halioglobus sp.]